MAKKVELNVVEYTKNPGPRYIRQGDHSGEDFYLNCLKPKFEEALESESLLVVCLDGPNGYASSFLDEAFGNLVYDYGSDLVSRKVTIISKEEPEWIQMLTEETYQEWEQRRKNEEAPTRTYKNL